MKITSIFSLFLAAIGIFDCLSVGFHGFLMWAFTCPFLLGALFIVSGLMIYWSSYDDEYQIKIKFSPMDTKDQIRDKVAGKAMEHGLHVAKYYHSEEKKSDESSSH